ncbi:MAG: sulfite exporter TauE/SafE family protein [Mycobacteriaceae bacterium]
MTGLAAAALVGAAGLAAGTINTVVGSGTLITFPVLLSLGVPPVTANVTNTIGLVPGSFSGAWGYRRELAGQREQLIRLGSASLIGGIAGALLLLVLPADVFQAAVPVLIALALALVVAQPRLSRRFVGEEPQNPKGAHPVLLWSVVLLAGVYGGYFGAAQGVLLMAAMGMLLDTDLQRVNGMKNVLAGLVNAVAGVIFAVLANPNWTYVAIIAVSSALGGQFGAQIGRRLSPVLLRGVIVVVGVAALAKLLFT